MKIVFVILLILGSLTWRNTALAQGPPITMDKAIMLGQGRTVLRNLTEIKSTAQGSYSRSAFMFHYLPTNNTLVALHLPFVSADLKDNSENQKLYLGDIQIKGKYQIYRKDQTGKTLRFALVTLQTLPTGKNFGVSDIDFVSSGNFTSYQGVVLGYEKLQYGIGVAFGYMFVPSANTDHLVYKVGFGLPLLKPDFPLRQINLYFEYAAHWEIQTKSYQILSTQSVQYAFGAATLEVGFRTPITQEVSDLRTYNHSLFLGGRIVL